MNITWVIKPLSTPTIYRNCSHCGNIGEFTCSNRFRINAQQKRIDVWLIYKCVKCGCTWNMDIFSRIKPEAICKELYTGFLNNDTDLAFRYAFDSQLLSRNKAAACHDNILYTVEGDIPSMDAFQNEPISLRITSQYELRIRLDRFLHEKTGITRKALDECLKTGVIHTNAGLKPVKAHINIKGEVILQFQPGIMKLSSGE